MNKYIFICNKNILRSQIAKGIFNNMHKGLAVAESYGLEVGEIEDTPIIQFPRMIDTVNLLKKEGIDISQERCHQLRLEFLENAKKIIVLSDEKNIPAWLKKYTFESWNIKYPEDLTTGDVMKMIDFLKVKISSLQ
jgi:protein-tyrosine-phosphatase